jgi:hypothetical protein
MAWHRNVLDKPRCKPLILRRQFSSFGQDYSTTTAPDGLPQGWGQVAVYAFDHVRWDGHRLQQTIPEFLDVRPSNGAAFQVDR